MLQLIHTGILPHTAVQMEEPVDDNHTDDIRQHPHPDVLQIHQINLLYREVKSHPQRHRRRSNHRQDIRNYQEYLTEQNIFTEQSLSHGSKLPFCSLFCLLYFSTYAPNFIRLSIAQWPFFVNKSEAEIQGNSASFSLFFAHLSNSSSTSQYSTLFRFTRYSA